MAAAVAAILVFVAVTLPPAPRSTTDSDAALRSRTVGGAFHVHTTRSDGAGDKAAVARAARRAGLQFVIVTDHGDGMRPSDPPEYLDGVLCLDGVEISTAGGHYIALGALPSPYPLGGESAAVVEDVARLGGFGIVAHPVSERRELSWDDWLLSIDGVEWLNADSEWRDEGRWPLARALAAYAVRPAAALASLLDRPDSTLARWDSLAASRRVVGIAGHDAHGGIGRRIEDPEARRGVGVPSYEASFRTFSTRVELLQRLTGDAATDGPALLDALKAGRFFTVIDAVAVASTLAFTARTATETARQGDEVRMAGAAMFTARAGAPAHSWIVAVRDGQVIAQHQGDILQFEDSRPGVYRVEVHVPGAPGQPPVPWLVSNPIFRRAPSASPPPSGSRTPPVMLLPPLVGWRVESDTGSQGSVRVVNSTIHFSYQLRPGERQSQYVALVVDLTSQPVPFDVITFVAQSKSPRRISVQLRFAQDGSARWTRSVYVDQVPRRVSVDVNEMRRAEGSAERPDIRRATSLMFVVDLTNARPGEAGLLTLER